MLAVGEETGKELAVSDLIGGAPTTEAIQIVSRKVARLRTFNSGDKLQFSQQDLWEICSFFQLIAIPTMVKSFEAFVRVHGLIFTEEQNTASEN